MVATFRRVHEIVWPVVSKPCASVIEEGKSAEEVSECQVGVGVGD